MENQIAVRTENQLAPTAEISEQGINIRSYDDMAKFSQMILNSNLAPKDFKTPEAIMVAIQTGMEIGLKPMQALQGIAVINGRPTIWGDAALAIVRNHPEFVDIAETFERGETNDEMMAVCVIERSGQTPTRRTFSVGDAKMAGLWKKSGPWTQYPKRMMGMRARAFALRDAFADALKGVSIREEVSDYQKAKAREVKPAEDILLPVDTPPEHQTETPEEPRGRGDVPTATEESEGERDENGDFKF